MNYEKTSNLLNKLMKTNNIDEYVKENSQYMNVSNISEYLESLLKEKNLNKAKIFEKANINYIYGYQIFSGTRHPSRDKLISICIGMELEFDKIQRALKIAGLSPLYPRVLRDSIIIFGIKEKQSLIKINHTLFDKGLNML